jgi:DinB superfamily
MVHFYSYQIQEITKKTKTFYLMNINLDYGAKPNPEKWSKKEVLGHLIDSALHNLRRFTECQFSKNTYLVTAYDQDMLVKLNNYQQREFSDLLKLWNQLNKQIAFILKDISEEQLKIKINLYNFSVCDLDFLIEDYITHLKHHLKQIFE